MAADVLQLDMAETLQGQSLDFVVDGGVVKMGDLQVITDIEASNGLIRVIDGVLLPQRALSSANAWGTTG